MKSISGAYQAKGDYDNAAAQYKTMLSNKKDAKYDDFEALAKIYLDQASDSTTAPAAKTKALQEADAVYADLVTRYENNKRYTVYRRASIGNMMDPDLSKGAAKPHYEELVAMLEPKADKDAGDKQILGIAYHYLMAYSFQQANDIPKAKEFAAKLLEINPDAEINAMQEIYTAENDAMFHLDDYDYIIDAIDSLQHKANLILRATECNGKLFSAMGAALKMDPTKVQVAEFWKVQGCPLARAVRNRFKRNHTFPKKKFLCVYSPELLCNKGKASTCGTSACMCPKAIIAAGNPSLVNHEWCSSKAQINGTVAHITAIFGFTISGLVIQDIVSS
jgi:tRNA A37 threonylcarbamoyladenosine dehydratase